MPIFSMALLQVSSDCIHTLVCLIDQCAASTTSISGPVPCVVDSSTGNRDFGAPSANESEESILRELYELVGTGNLNANAVDLPRGSDSLPNDGDFLELDDLFPASNVAASALTSSDMPLQHESMVSDVLKQECFQPTTPEVII
jgi:hypothetical protein